MLRLFTGVSIPPKVRHRLHPLQGGVPGAKWTHPDDYHITLSFIGEVDEGTAEDIDEVLSGIRAPAFNLSLKGVGHFSRGIRRDVSGSMPGYLWIGVEHSESLHRLKEKIDRTFETHKIPFERRKYTPHVTVARLKHADASKVAAFIQEHNLFSSEPFAVEDFVLYQSHAGDEARYEELATHPLSSTSPLPPAGED